METSLSVRSLHTLDELQPCVDLQRETWGSSFDDVVSAMTMLVCLKVGGIAAGAFDASGRLVGMVFGLTGPRGGRVVHWSHMLAIERTWRNRGVGRRLKAFQRERALEMGIDTMYWTYDPLESRNAHFNLNRLGATIAEYVRDLYGAGDTSPLFRGIGTDRFVAAWHLRSRRAEDALAGQHPGSSTGVDDAPRVVTAGPEGSNGPTEHTFADAARVRIEIPSHIQRLKARAPDEALRWRQATRRAFEHYLEQGYQVDGFSHDPATNRSHYILSAPV